MLKMFFILEGVELLMFLACVGVFYYRRDILIPLFRRYIKDFLGMHHLEAMTYRNHDKVRLHAKRLNRHLRHINVLEGKPARKMTLSVLSSDDGGDNDPRYDGFDDNWDEDDDY